MSAIAALLWHRTGEAEDAPCEDPGYALITGFARTCAEVSAAMNMSPMAASQMVGHAEALDTRLPKVARLLAQGRIDWRTVQLIITRTALVHGDLMAQLDQQLTERITSRPGPPTRRIRHPSAAVRTRGLTRRRVALPAHRGIGALDPLPRSDVQLPRLRPTGLGRADIDHTIAFNHTGPSAGGLTVPGNNKCYCRQH
jgi:Domain of unknown function (DUF222)